MIPTTQPRDYPDVDLQEVAKTYDQAATAARLSRLDRTDSGRTIIRALDLIPALAAHVARLRRRLGRAIADLGNLTAAARATLGANRDGETDPLYYLRDELRAQGSLPPDEPERP